MGISESACQTWSNDTNQTSLDRAVRVLSLSYFCSRKSCVVSVCCPDFPTGVCPIFCLYRFCSLSEFGPKFEKKWCQASVCRVFCLDSICRLKPTSNTNSVVTASPSGSYTYTKIWWMYWLNSPLAIIRFDETRIYINRSIGTPFTRCLTCKIISAIWSK